MIWRARGLAANFGQHFPGERTGNLSKFAIGLTDHVEGPQNQAATTIFDEVSDLVCLADQLGVHYAWFAEHHAHAHHGHLPTPLLFALHLAGQTRRIRLGTAIICLNLHHPLDVAEQVAVADLLSGGRLAVGFGSGSTPAENELFGFCESQEDERHLRFEESLRIICSAWKRTQTGTEPEVSHLESSTGAHQLLPKPSVDLQRRCWVAVNSPGSARIAGKLDFNVLFSHLRTPDQYRQFVEIYRAAGGTGLVAANRPVFVGPDDASAFALAEPALRILWRRFHQEGKIPVERTEPSLPVDLCGHPINFLVGGPGTVARQLLELHEEVPFDVANLELRWAGMPHEMVRGSLQRLMELVVPRLDLGPS
jgi:alkanesulfonate monooxygenase SsuD/methylene tetrahydromethanopterin reductase-like flavin-dependent oxidoreductase (luciferase family)